MRCFWILDFARTGECLAFLRTLVFVQQTFRLVLRYFILQLLHERARGKSLGTNVIAVLDSFRASGAMIAML